MSYITNIRIPLSDDEYLDANEVKDELGLTWKAMFMEVVKRLRDTDCPRSRNRLNKQQAKN